MKTKSLTMLILLILCGAFFAPALADTVKLASDGTLHRIEVMHLEGSTNSNPRTYLLHTLQKPDGTIQKYIIPQTDDIAADIEPQLDLNPSSMLPCIIWSRFDGLDYEIALSSFNGVRWSSPNFVTVNNNNDRGPQIAIGTSSVIHLMWKEDSPGIPLYYHLSFSLMSRPTSIPQMLTPPDDNLVLPDGSTSPASNEPIDESIFFVFYVPSPQPKRLVVWGGHDDPSPINYQQGFKIPDTLENITSLKAEKVNGMLTVMFRSSDMLYYTYKTASGWTPYRMIKIDASMSEEKAVQLIKDLIGKLPQ